MQTSTASIIGYGKLPVHGDFVRYNATGRAVRALDEWLQRGLYLAKAQLGAQFEAAYDAAPAYRFLFRPEDAESTIIGVLRPSRDRSRRTFPFLIAAESDAPTTDPRRLARTPVRFGSFLDQADRLTQEIVAGQVAHRDVGDWLEQSGLPAAAADGSTTAYERYLRETTLQVWCEGHWEFFDDSRKYFLFRNLLELLAPLQGHVPPGFTLGLNFPLGDAGSTELAVAFWLDLCLHVLRFPAVAPVCFWTAGAPESARGRFVVFFRLPPPRAMVQLFPTESHGDHVCDLETMSDGDAAEAALAIPPRIGALLESHDVSLQEFLESL